MRPRLMLLDAGRTIWRERTRFVLASSPVVLIAAGLVASLAVVAGVDADVTARMRALGLGNVFVQFDNESGLRQISIQTVQSIRALPEVHRVARFASKDAVEVAGGGRMDALLVDRDFFEIFAVERRSGRLPNAVDARRPGILAVVAEDAARGTARPPGSESGRLQIGGAVATVTGSMVSRGGLPAGLLGLLGQTKPDVILVPTGDAWSTERSARFDSAGIVVAALDAAAVSAVVPQIGRLLGAALRESGSARFVLPRDLLEAERQFLDQVRGYVILAAGLLAAVGLGSMVYARMLSVNERRTEIGLRRAVGASRGSVAILIVAESLGAGVVAAMVGCCIGSTLAAPLASALDAPSRLPWGALPWIILLCGVFSAIAGLLPAVRAAALDPTEAIRG
jgi:putative ABC transport system permease protein